MQNYYFQVKYFVPISEHVSIHNRKKRHIIVAIMQNLLFGSCAFPKKKKMQFCSSSSEYCANILISTGK